MISITTNISDQAYVLAKISTNVSSLMTAYRNDSFFSTDGRLCIMLFYVMQSLPFPGCFAFFS